MAETALRVFSYLPNPRVFKATIAARLCGIQIDLRGAAPRDLPRWLWDFDARPLTEAELSTPQPSERRGRTGFSGRLFKTDAFLEAHPFGTVPAAFSPDGRVGIFESNSIMRAVARVGQAHFPVYGEGPYQAARVDSFLDVALLFARDSQLYLLDLNSETPSAAPHAAAQRALTSYLGGIEHALAPPRRYLVGENLTLADICFAAELALLFQERTQLAALGRLGLAPITAEIESQSPRAMSHYRSLCQHPAFAPDLGPYLEKIAQRERDGERVSASAQSAP